MRYHNTVIPCHLLKCPRGSLFLIPQDEVVRFEETCALVGASWENDEAYFEALGHFDKYEVDDLRVFAFTTGSDSL